MLDLDIPDNWLKTIHPHIEILDRDGWRDQSWYMPLSLGEFEARLSECKVRFNAR